MASLIIRGGTVVNHDHSRRADVLIEGETIVAVRSALDAPSGATVVDAGGCYLMPGGIHPHTPLELAFLGSLSSDHFELGPHAPLARRRTLAGGCAGARGPRSRGPRLLPPTGGRRRGDQPRHHDRRHDGCAALCGAHELPRVA